MNSKTSKKIPSNFQKIINKESESWVAEVAKASTNRFNGSLEALRIPGSTVTVLPKSKRAVMA